MFTGIVQELGTVARLATRGGVDRLTIEAPQTARGLAVGESVAVNGACLSAVEIGRGSLTFEMIPETRRRTSLGRLKVGHQVHLERSLTLQDRLGGHVVLGHVDGLATVTKRAVSAGQTALHLRVNRALGKLLVPKGPVALDGVSLTVGLSVSATTFTVFLIPETLRKTTLGERRPGDALNIELDYFAKLLARWAKFR